MGSELQEKKILRVRYGFRVSGSGLRKAVEGFKGFVQAQRSKTHTNPRTVLLPAFGCRSPCED